LAILENDSDRRKALRRNAINICKEQFQREIRHSQLLAVTYADRSVDLFYDQFIREDRTFLNSIFADVKRLIRQLLQIEENPNNRILLLTQYASILRCQAQISDYKNRYRRINEAVRCSNNAVSEDPNNPNGYLSLGQSLWVQARVQSSDLKYFEFMNRAENALIEAKNGFAPISDLVLSRFYRQTYRPALSVSTFMEYANIEKRNRRRILSESFLIAEAAIQMWYNSYELSEQALSEGQKLLREAIDSGYENTRNLLGLAYVEAALGDLDTSLTVLSKIFGLKAINWADIIEMAQKAIQKKDVKLLEKGFALGISDSSVWNSIGTYTKTFLNDLNVAISIYEIGRILNPKNYVLLTNLSRALIEKGDRNSLVSAKSYLNMAADYSAANKAFIWWRNVKDQLKRTEGKQIEQGYKFFQVSPNSHLNFKHVQKRFRKLLYDDVSPHERGKLFEIIFIDLLKLTFGSEVVHGSHHVKVGGQRQVDASFKWQQTYYRVELKWHDRPIGPDKLDSFLTILKTAEVRGVFISMSGFTEGAVENAREIGKTHTILLFDRKDTMNIFEGNSKLETVLDKKLFSFQKTGNPYAKSSYKSPTCQFT